MTKIATLPKKFLALTVLLATYVISAQAQQAATGTKTQPAKAATYQIVNVAEVSEPADSKENAGEVYYRYKGIANIEEAKLAWIKDNPETYRKMTEEGARPASPKAGSRTTGTK